MALEPGISITFEVRQIKNDLESERRGHVVFREEEWAEIRIAGRDLYNPVIVPARVTREIKQQFQEEYDAWKKGEDVPLNGTPLSEWPQIGRQEADMLKQMQVRSVEEFAAAREDLVTVIPHGRTLQNKAKAWLQAASSTGKTAETIASLQATVESLQMQIEQLGEQPRAAPARPRRKTAAKKRGRPRKVKAAAKKAPAAPPTATPETAPGGAPVGEAA